MPHLASTMMNAQSFLLYLHSTHLTATPSILKQIKYLILNYFSIYLWKGRHSEKLITIMALSYSPPEYKNKAIIPKSIFVLLMSHCLCFCSSLSLLQIIRKKVHTLQSVDMSLKSLLIYSFPFNSFFLLFSPCYFLVWRLDHLLYNVSDSLDFADCISFNMFLCPSVFPVN